MVGKLTVFYIFLFFLMNLVARHTLDKLLALKLAIMVSDLVGKVDLIKCLINRKT